MTTDQQSERYEAEARELIQAQESVYNEFDFHKNDDDPQLEQALQVALVSWLQQRDAKRDAEMLSREQMRKVLQERIEASGGIDEIILNEYKMGYIACYKDIASALSISLTEGA